MINEILSRENIFDFQKELGVRIKQLREAQNLSYLDFEGLARISVGDIKNLESGRSDNITLSTLLKVSDGLGIDITDLLRF